MQNLIQKLFFAFWVLTQINSQCSSCNRFYEIQTVCGENGVTYKNTCYARCNDTQISHEGACDDSNGPCGCPVEDEPVCDMDQVIYQNECIANCKGKVAIPSRLCDFGMMQDENMGSEEIPLVVRGQNQSNQNAQENGKNYNYRDSDYDDVDPMNLYYGTDIIDFYDSRHGDEFTGLKKDYRRNAGEAS